MARIDCKISKKVNNDFKELLYYKKDFKLIGNEFNRGINALKFNIRDN